MRPEYVDAVDAVRWGWSLWLVFLVPAAIIWSAVFTRPFPQLGSRTAVGCGAFALACFSFWFLTIAHGNRIQSAKARHMDTDAEREDWASDTWQSFAPFTAIPASIVYCTLHLLAAGIVRGIGGLVLRFASARRGSSVTATDVDEDQTDDHPYQAPRSL